MTSRVSQDQMRVRNAVSRNQVRQVVPSAHSIPSMKLPITTDGQGRMMLSNDVLRQAIEQSRLDSPSCADFSPSRGTNAVYRQPARRRPEEKSRRCPSLQTKTSGEKLPSGRIRVLKPPPEVVDVESDSHSSPEPESRKSKRRFADEGPGNWQDLRSQRIENLGQSFRTSVGRVSGRGNDCSSITNNASATYGNELSYRGGNNNGMVSSFSTNANNGVVSTFSARSNNNNNNNGVVSTFSARYNNNNNMVSSSVNNNSFRSTMKNPIFLTVVTDNLNKVLPTGVTLKRPKEEPEDEPVQAVPRLCSSSVSCPPSKKRRVELGTAQCVLCPCCDFINLSTDEVLRHVKEAHPDQYLRMTSMDDDEIGVECGDCCIKFPSIDMVRSHMHGSHGTSRFVLQAIPVTENEKSLSSEAEELSDEDSRSSLSSTASYRPPPFHDAAESESDYPISPVSNGVATDSGLDVASNTTSVEDSDALDGPIQMMCGVEDCPVAVSTSKISLHRACHSHGGYTCPQCGVSEQVWGHMALHLWRMHQIDVDLKQCPHCDFRHYRTEGLNAHAGVHWQMNILPCDVCGKRFKKNAQLLKHKANVHSHPTLKCPFCPQKFSCQSFLDMHFRDVHDKPSFHCDACDYKSTNVQELSAHKSIHHGEKRFKCTACPFTSDDRSNYRRHLAVHTTLHICPLCEFSSSKAELFKNHVTVHHPDSFSEILNCCPLCEKAFVTQKGLKKHVTTCHPHEIAGTSSSSVPSTPLSSVVASEIPKSPVPETVDSFEFSHGDVTGVSTIIADGYTLTVPSVMILSNTPSKIAESSQDYHSGLSSADFNLESYDLFDGNELYQLMEDVAPSIGTVNTPQGPLQFLQ